MNSRKSGGGHVLVMKFGKCSIVCVQVHQGGNRVDKGWRSSETGHIWHCTTSWVPGDGSRVPGSGTKMVAQWYQTRAESIRCEPTLRRGMHGDRCPVHGQDQRQRIVKRHVASGCAAAGNQHQLRGKTGQGRRNVWTRRRR
jgi:hypothetical protein